MYETTPSAADVLIAQRNPINPAIQNRNGDVPLNPVELFASLFGSTNPQPSKFKETPTDTDSGLGWLYEDPKPAATSTAGTLPNPASNLDSKPTQKSADYTPLPFKLDQFSLYDDQVTPDNLSKAIGDLYSQGAIKPVIVDQSVLDKFKVGDFSEFGTVLGQVQQQAHTQAIVGLLNMLPSLMSGKLEGMFNQYTNHREFSSAHQQSLSNQDPLVGLVMEAALNKYRAKNPTATASQILDATKGIQEALKKKFAAPQQSAQPQKAQSQNWDEFLS